MPEEHVHIGDIWRDNDKRIERYVKVIAVDDGAGCASIRTCTRDGATDPLMPLTRAKLSRFGKGYVRP